MGVTYHHADPREHLMPPRRPSARRPRRRLARLDLAAWRALFAALLTGAAFWGGWALLILWRY